MLEHDNRNLRAPRRKVLPDIGADRNPGDVPAAKLGVAVFRLVEGDNQQPAAAAC